MTANLENCRRLFELSGWGGLNEARVPRDKYRTNGSLQIGPYKGYVRNGEIPAYTAGYLLDKLAPLAKEVGRLSLEYCNTDDGWMWYIGYNDLADNTPSITHPDKTDAACLLTIKLFETGVLKK